MMPRACSALPDLVMMSEVSALKSCDPAMPASTICPLLCSPPPPAACASSATSVKASTAPPKAPAVMEMAPAPSPATVTSTAPVEAPAEMPSKYGSASALRSSDCRMTPDSASPVPQHMATMARVRR